MDKYFPIFVMDEDDTLYPEDYSITKFLNELDCHVKNVNGATYDNVFLNIKTEWYENDYGIEIPMGTIEFRIKK